MTSHSERDYEPPPDGQFDEETKGLLHQSESEHVVLDIQRRRDQHRYVVWCLVAVIIFLVLVAFAIRPFVYHPQDPAHKNALQVDEDLSIHSDLRSNGTHHFNKTLIMVSIDGLRADYLDRGLTPHLFTISQVGLRAKHMQPIFPTITFPNHWSILTGLYAESHGIVGNHFWDDKLGEFVFSDPSIASKSNWWDGEPIWETLENAGVKTANLMWIGPPETPRGVKPTYFSHFRNHVPLHEKHDQIMNWVDLPFHKRPQLILAYEPSLDQAGHATGPGSALVNATLVEVDEFARNLHQSLAARNLSSIVDIIFVSDHGMADTGHVDWVFLEDIIGPAGCDAVEREDGWPSMGLRFIKGANTTGYLEQIEAAAKAQPDKFAVYTQETMPTGYHFARNPRIAPVFIVPSVGYAVSLRRGKHTLFVKGNHGYDNDIPAMQAMFVADGPFTEHIKRRDVTRQNSEQGYNGYVIEAFRNLEIKALVGRLLGVFVTPESHNGTVGFWDKYL